MKLAILGFLTIVLVSCKKDIKPQLSKEDLQGKWMLTEAFRGDKPTQTLSGAYYEFKDTILITNIFGDNFSAGYSIENMDIVQRIPIDIRYTVAKNPDQTMSFLTMIDGIPFRFTLKKV
ncbi:MAG: hypothetical protein HOP11_11095 [Saprospiraceae bacterium]|nr:hypothetical protein [Saprospiraceae bacterium]